MSPRMVLALACLLAGCNGGCNTSKVTAERKAKEWAAQHLATGGLKVDVDCVERNGAGVAECTVLTSSVDGLGVIPLRCSDGGCWATMPVRIPAPPAEAP